jgi:antitoxin CptB
MSGTTRSSADLDPRRKRILFRAWHRGMREMDMIMGPFCDAHVADFTPADIEAFEALIDQTDRDLLGWIIGSDSVPPEHDTPVFRRLKDFHNHLAPRFA